MKKILVTLGKILAVVVGLWLLWGTIQKVSWTALFQLFQERGFVLLLCVFIYPFACIFHAMALRALLATPDRRRASFKAIYAVRLIGDSVNKLTPFVDIGGEPFKMLLMAKRKITTPPQAVIAVWMSRIGFVFTEIIFVLAGWFLIHRLYPGFNLTWVIWVGLVISCVYFGILSVAQLRGAVNVIPRLANNLKIRVENGMWEEADQGLRSFYSSRTKHYVISLFWQLLGWIAEFVEVYLFFMLLGLPITWTQAFIFQSILQAIKTASFLIPANLGAQEGGLSVLAVHLGYSATNGFALSLIKRFRHFFWIIVGLCLWKFLNHREA